jgi:S-adenosylmethionine hydrolase
VRIDRFGNVVTNLDRKSCERLADGGGALQLTVGGRAIARIVSTYSEIAPGDIGALFGSTDHLECAAQSASAAEVLGVSVGDLAELRKV